VSEAREWRKVYYPGDEIRMRLALAHDPTITAVDVVYVNVSTRNPTYTLTLSGYPEPQEDSPPAGEDKRSIVEVSAVVDVAHLPGHYGVARVMFYSFSGRAYKRDADETGVDGWPILEIRDEPDSVKVIHVELEPSD
jgi:hypothetical protein